MRREDSIPKKTYLKILFSTLFAILFLGLLYFNFQEDANDLNSSDSDITVVLLSLNRDTSAIYSRIKFNLQRSDRIKINKEYVEVPRNRILSYSIPITRDPNGWPFNASTFAISIEVNDEPEEFFVINNLKNLTVYDNEIMCSSVTKFNLFILMVFNMLLSSFMLYFVCELWIRKIGIPIEIPIFAVLLMASMYISNYFVKNYENIKTFVDYRIYDWCSIVCAFSSVLLFVIYIFRYENCKFNEKSNDLQEEVQSTNFI